MQYLFNENWPFYVAPHAVPVILLLLASYTVLIAVCTAGINVCVASARCLMFDPLAPKSGVWTNAPTSRLLLSHGVRRRAVRGTQSRGFSYANYGVIGLPQWCR